MKYLQIMTAVFKPVSGFAGLGVTVAHMHKALISSLCEQGDASCDYMQMRAIFRAMELGKHLKASHITVLCQNEKIAKTVKKAHPHISGKALSLFHTRIREIMRSFEFAEVIAVPEHDIEKAKKLAISASRFHEPSL